MSHALGRRAATAVAMLTTVAGALLAVGGTASAASGPTVDRGAAVASHPGSTTRYGNGNADIRSHSGYGRSDDRRESRWDGHRSWHRTGVDWYCNDRGEQYRYDGRLFYRWDHGSWDVATGGVLVFDSGIFN
ncbi:hypothetical protein EDD90_10283 [Streptomyces sp. Ag109_O5-1]|uniref:hypothetical protein n=1 Tax=Streptomyces sp. Ag109_O5-1 TaxID=1938851 RepID=UPI000F4F5A53|nr:hypothetical protein [Streptomyces sp. Ag109_O5-1]RPE46898.1 hypothetical protein EDD90_10283 [Streptomyces sp. Ag109_O5-1]